MLIHVVGHAPSGAAPFKVGEVADRFWLKLRIAFPEALGACLLPAQVHLLLPSAFEPRSKSAPQASGGPAAGALGLLLGALSRTLGGGNAWAPVTTRVVAPEALALLGEVRALHFRPYKLGLTSHPVEWPWSTERDLLGARLDPWVTAERIARHARCSGAPLGVAEVRRFVSGESSLATASDSMRAAPRAPGANLDHLCRLVEAANCACLYAPRALRNAVAVHLGHAHGYHDRDALAVCVGVSPASVDRILRTSPPPGLECAALCASDPRLTFRPAAVACAG